MELNETTNWSYAAHSCNIAHHVKQPCGEARVKLLRTPAEGTTGSSTRGTFSAYCLPAAEERAASASTTADESSLGFMAHEESEGLIAVCGV